MGEVYRARDAKLGRSVAIKVLPDVFASDPDRVSRFEREAKALAALNHPHIATLHGLEQAGSRHFLVMELVEGETLAERLQRGPLPVEDALEIAHQMADALETAHEKGIVHRDLKPANVKITPEEKVKILDFGLAKAMEVDSLSGAAIANSPTFSQMATQAGVILGTAAYMSPEQAKGFPADHRSDIFSFGVVLYEMLAGRQPFQGETVSDILASVLVREPDLGALPSGLNPRLTELVRRCLDKHPRRRWQAIGDLRVEIETIAVSPHAVPAPAQTVAAAPRSLWKRAMPVAAGAVLAAAVTGLTVWTLRPAPRPMVARFSVSLGEGETFTNTVRRMIAISPDGTLVVYVASRKLFLRSMSDLEARPVPGTDGFQQVSDPVFSPDGGSLAFWAASDQTIKRIAVSGGAAVTICRADSPRDMAWEDDTILFTQGGTIMRVSASGGQPDVLVRLKDDELAHGPRLLPDGQSVLFTLATATGADRWDKATIVVHSLKSGERKTLIEGGTDARYLPTGHLVYALGGVLFGVPFDLRRLAVTGGPVPVVEGVRRAVGQLAAANYSVSRTGSIAYIPGPVTTSSAQLQLALFDRNGDIEPLKAPPGPYYQPRLSPDGLRVAFSSDDGKEATIWVYDLSTTSAIRRLTFEGRNRHPIWSADSQRVVFQSDREGDLSLFWQRADGTGTAERLTRAEQGAGHVPQSWSPDGERVLFDVVKASDIALWVFSVRDKKAVPFDSVATSTSTGAVFSPDGRWVAYSTREAGRSSNAVYVQPFPPTGAKYQISKNSEDGHHQVWSPDGTELFYTPGPGNLLVAVSISTRPSFTFGEASALARPFLNAPPAMERTYDVARDGRRFLGLAESLQTNAGTVSAPRFHVVLNWFEELNARVPTGR
jgi:serine/threonine-protein kinase